LGSLSIAKSILSAPADFFEAGVGASGAELREPLGSGSAIAGVCRSSRVTATSPTGEGRSSLTHKLGRARLVSICDGAVRFVLVTDVEAPVIMVYVPSALVSSSDTLVAGRDPVEMNTVEADEVECTIFPSLIALFRLFYSIDRSYISNQSRFHSINRLAFTSLFIIGLENGDHNGFDSECCPV